MKILYHRNESLGGHPNSTRNKEDSYSYSTKSARYAPGHSNPDVLLTYGARCGLPEGCTRTRVVPGRKVGLLVESLMSFRSRHVVNRQGRSPGSLGVVRPVYGLAGRAGRRMSPSFSEASVYYEVRTVSLHHLCRCIYNTTNQVQWDCNLIVVFRAC